MTTQQVPAQSPPAAGDAVAEFSEHRKRLVRHAVKALNPDAAIPIIERFDAVPALSEVVVAALESLKVAEEELVASTEEMAEARDRLERDAYHYRLIFDLAPVALLVTDRNGAILEVNKAAAALLRRDVYHLERKPVTSMIPQDSRTQFRELLRRLTLTEGVTRWVFTIERATDAPVTVTAAVHVIPDGPGGSALYWALRPVDGPDR